MKKIFLFSPSVRFAMGQYTEKHTNLLSDHYLMSLVVPKHYNGQNTKLSLYKFYVGNKFSALFKNLSPFLHIKIWLMIYKKKPDILHILNSEGYPLSITLSLIAKILKIKVIITVHDPTPHPGSYIDIIASKLRIITLSLADKIHIHYSDSDFLSNNIYKDKTVIVKHLDFSERFTQYRQSNIKIDNDILFFGRIEAYKGIELLINASRLLPSETTITIAGPGKLSHSATLKLKKMKIKFINKYLSDKEVCNLFQRSNTLVLPYLQSTQSSLPCIANSFGVRIVSTKTGSFINEVPELGGIIVDSTPEALAHGLLESINSQSNHTNRQLNLNEIIRDSFIALYDEI